MEFGPSGTLPFGWLYSQSGNPGTLFIHRTYCISLPCPHVTLTSIECEPNNYIRNMEFFDVGKTCIGEREPLQLILRFQPWLLLGTGPVDFSFHSSVCWGLCFLGQSPPVLFIVLNSLPHWVPADAALSLKNLWGPWTNGRKSRGQGTGLLVLCFTKPGLLLIIIIIII